MLKKIALLLLILACILSLASCKSLVETSMYVEEGSIPMSFSVDDPFPDTARICVVSDAGTKTYAITPDMVEDFDTSLSTYGAKKTMVIKRGKLSVEYKYSVDGDVNTKARIVAETESTGNECTIILSLTGLTEEEGMIAMQMSVTANSSLASVKEVKCLASGYKAVTHLEGQKLGIVCYTEDADNRMTEDTALVSITYTKRDTHEIMLTISGDSGYIEITQGEGTKHLPTCTIMI